MLASLIIVFREVLESALIIGVVMAASRGVARRGLWISAGILAGIFGSGLVAAFASAIANAAEGMGMELFNAALLATAVVMLGWHNIWMASHGRAMANEAGAKAQAVRDGQCPMAALAMVVGIAVLREGSETVLFLYGILIGGNSSVTTVLTGGLLGILAGSAVGVALYQGMLRMQLRHLFAVSGWMILLLACGLAAQCAGLLVQADLLPPLGMAIWDTSAILSESSVLGSVLHTLVGYIAQPDGVQVAAYIATFLVIGGLMRLVPREGRVAVGQGA